MGPDVRRRLLIVDDALHAQQYSTPITNGKQKKSRGAIGEANDGLHGLALLQTLNLTLNHPLNALVQRIVR